MVVEPIIFFVDDMNNERSFGYTDNVLTVDYNLSLISSLDIFKNYNNTAKSSKNGLQTVFPIGRYLVIVKSSKDGSKKEMVFLDFRIEYSLINKAASVFTPGVLLALNKIKYGYSEVFTNELEDFIMLAYSYN